MTADEVDRGAAIRQALIELVAEQGLHGTAMGQLARRAGVATGTIYVHYVDKDSLILSVFADVKRDLGLAAQIGWNPDLSAEQRFLGAWNRVHTHLMERPERARFLLQLEASPYAKAVHHVHDDVAAVWSGMTESLGDAVVELPPEVLYDLALGPAVTLAANADRNPIHEAVLAVVARGCWRAITR